MLSNFVSLVLLTGVQFSGQACSQTPLAACAFGARNLPDPVLTRCFNESLHQRVI